MCTYLSCEACKTEQVDEARVIFFFTCPKDPFGAHVYNISLKYCSFPINIPVKCKVFSKFHMKCLKSWKHGTNRVPGSVESIRDARQCFEYGTLGGCVAAQDPVVGKASEPCPFTTCQVAPYLLWVLVGVWAFWWTQIPPNIRSIVNTALGLSENLLKRTTKWVAGELLANEVQ